MKQEANKQAYTLSKGDLEIFTLAKDDPNVFTNYYLKGPETGTWWMPGAETERWSQGYAKLTAVWAHENKPEKFRFGGNPYTVRWEHELALLYPDMPAFHHNHGVLQLPYQVELYQDRTPIRTIIGGMGAGKTMGMVINLLVMMATMPQFEAIWLAPTKDQAEQFMKLAIQLTSGTLYEKLFMRNYTMGDHPKFHVWNSHVGLSTVTCYPILNKEMNLRTITVDLAVIDQAEHQLLDLYEMIKSVGSRLRGRVAKTGRGRVGTVTLLANADDNQDLWDIYDKADEDPANYKSMAPTSYDNPWLTDKDLSRMKLMVGNDSDNVDRYMFGNRPLGDGVHFSRQTLEGLQHESLDRVMKIGLDNNLFGYEFVEVPGAKTVKWFLPPVDGRVYLVVSDPGTANPPERDSPVIMVWDITGFPGTVESRQPASLVGFWWVHGRRDIRNWANAYHETVVRYRAFTTNAFDGTGYQAGYDTWISILTNLNAERITLSASSKPLMLNAAKVLSAHRMVRIPKAIKGFFNQAPRYEYPNEPKKLKQDIVITFMMSCWWMQRLYNIFEDEYSVSQQLSRTARRRKVKNYRKSR